VLRDSVKNFRTHGQNCELENTQINGSSFGLAGSMGTGSGQSPSSLDDTATTSWSLISQGHRSLETRLSLCFSVFLFVPPLPAGLLFQGWEPKNKNTQLVFFLRFSKLDLSKLLKFAPNQPKSKGGTLWTQSGQNN
jgi:hypothetical protein